MVSKHTTKVYSTYQRFVTNVALGASSLGKFTYQGQGDGILIKNSVDSLRSQGHTILGGFIFKGPLNDTFYNNNQIGDHAMTVCFSSYYNVPYQITVVFTVYQTINLGIMILYN